MRVSFLKLLSLILVVDLFLCQEDDIQFQRDFLTLKTCIFTGSSICENCENSDQTCQYRFFEDTQSGEDGKVDGKTLNKFIIPSDYDDWNELYTDSEYFEMTREELVENEQKLRRRRICSVGPAIDYSGYSKQYGNVATIVCFHFEEEDIDDFLMYRTNPLDDISPDSFHFEIQIMGEILTRVVKTTWFNETYEEIISGDNSTNKIRVTNVRHINSTNIETLSDVLSRISFKKSGEKFFLTNTTYVKFELQPKLAVDTVVFEQFDQMGMVVFYFVLFFSLVITVVFSFYFFVESCVTGLYSIALDDQGYNERFHNVELDNSEFLTQQERTRQGKSKQLHTDKKPKPLDTSVCCLIPFVWVLWAIFRVFIGPLLFYIVFIYFQPQKIIFGKILVPFFRSSSSDWIGSLIGAEKYLMFPARFDKFISYCEYLIIDEEDPKEGDRLMNQLLFFSIFILCFVVVNVVCLICFHIAITCLGIRDSKIGLFSKNWISNFCCNCFHPLYFTMMIVYVSSRKYFKIMFLLVKLLLLVLFVIMISFDIVKFLLFFIQFGKPIGEDDIRYFVFFLVFSGLSILLGLLKFVLAVDVSATLKPVFNADHLRMMVRDGYFPQPFFRSSYLNNYISFAKTPAILLHRLHVFLMSKERRIPLAGNELFEYDGECEGWSIFCCFYCREDSVDFKALLKFFEMRPAKIKLPLIKKSLKGSSSSSSYDTTNTNSETTDDEVSESGEVSKSGEVSESDDVDSSSSSEISSRWSVTGVMSDSDLYSETVTSSSVTSSSESDQI